MSVDRTVPRTLTENAPAAAAGDFSVEKGCVVASFVAGIGAESSAALLAAAVAVAVAVAAAAAAASNEVSAVGTEAALSSLDRS